MKAKKKKEADTSGYQQFAFRVPHKDKEAEKTLNRIKKNIERLHKHYKSVQKDDERVIKKNDIILSALDKGLEDLIKKI